MDVASRILPSFLGLKSEKINQKAADHLSTDDQAKQKCDHSPLHVDHAFAVLSK